MTERYVWLTAGSVVGAFAGGWFASKAFYRGQNEKEILEMREYYKGKLEEIAGEALEEASRRPSERSKLASKPSLESIRANSIINQYTSVVEPYRASEGQDGFEAKIEEIEEDEVEKAELERLNDYGQAKIEEHREMAKLDPKIIRAEDFGEEDEFDTTELFYFTEDDKLVTEDDEEIEDPVGLLGNALTKYDFTVSDEEDLFVRNYRLRTDYHIRKIEGEYNQ